MPVVTEPVPPFFFLPLLLPARGVEDASAWAWISSHVLVRRSTSARSSSSLAPSAAVRTMTPALSGTTSRRIFFRRARSVSGSLRLMPVIEAFGT